MPQPEAGLVVAEAVSLAGNRGGGAIALSLALAEGRLRGTVAGGGVGSRSQVEAWEAACAPDLAELLIANLADRWGVEEESGQIWFEIVVDP